MHGISLLIFSRNDVNDAVGLVKELYDKVDDVVVVDSSERGEHAKLLLMKKKLALNRMRVYYVVALGYPEPLRQYGFNKCKNDWILLLDTDERINPVIVSQLQRLVSDKEINGYYFRRYEKVRGNELKNSFFTWQLRLFRKTRVSCKGLIHETPKVAGRTVHVGDRDAYMEHREELKETHEFRGYNRMYLFDPSPAYKLIARNIYIAYRLRGLASIFTLKDSVMEVLNGRRDRTPEIDAITRTVGRVGVTRYLDLDKDETIRNLNSKYRNGKQGVDLLIKLILERYRRQKSQHV